MTIKIDLSKVKTSLFIAWSMNPANLYLMQQVLDQAIEGGVSDRSITELPAIVTKFMVAMDEYQTDLLLAISSMRLHLKGDKDD